MKLLCTDPNIICMKVNEMNIDLSNLMGGYTIFFYKLYRIDLTHKNKRHELINTEYSNISSINQRSNIMLQPRKHNNSFYNVLALIQEFKKCIQKPTAQLS